MIDVSNCRLAYIYCQNINVHDIHYLNDIKYDF